MDLNSSVSPYIVSFPVSGPGYFYGRCHQINQFFNVLRSQALQSQRVLGLRRSGKTSFLHHIAHPKIAHSALQGYSHPPVIAYVDLLAGIETPSDFYLAVADSIAGYIPSDVGSQVPNEFPTFRSFREWLVSILAPPKNLRLVVLLDEFEVLTQSPRFEASFFQGLRALATSQLMWVTATYSDLYTLRGQDGEEDRSSPFFNVFHPTPIIIGPLEPEETQRLIYDPAKSRGVEFSPGEVQAIQDIAGALPYFLQATAEQWFSTRRPTMSVERRREKVLEQLLDPFSLIQNQLSRYWQRLTGQEQDCLCQVAQGKLSRRTNSAVEQKLLRFGLLSQDNDSLKVAGEVFRRWVEDNYLEIKRRVLMDPSNVAPFVPIIVEATKFVFNEASKWIDSIRQNASDETLPPEITLALPVTEAQFSQTQTDLPAMVAMMDSAMAEMLADEIQGLVKQIKIHRRNLTNLEVTEAKYGIDVPTRVQGQIEDESKSIVEKTTRLVELLKQIYQK
jgi:hypothetical protein